MGIALNATHLLVTVLTSKDRRPDKDVLTLGVQDCYFDYPSLAEFFQRNGIEHVDVAPGEREYAEGFFQYADYDRVKIANNVHQRTLLQSLGFAKDKILAVDINDFEGAEIVHDLNEPVPHELYGRFDLIIESGTIEHVFSLKDAFFNLVRMCRVRGLIVQFCPVDMINHGFVNLNATLLLDFYKSNGFECEFIKYVAIPMDEAEAERSYLLIDPYAISAPLPEDYILAVFSAFRKKLVVPLTIPIQTYYRNLFEEVKGRVRNPQNLQSPVEQAAPASEELGPRLSVHGFWKTIFRAHGGDERRQVDAVQKTPLKSHRPMPEYQKVEF